MTNIDALSWQSILDETVATSQKTLDSYQPELQIEEVGIVTYLSGGIARAVGLPRVQAEELVRFPGNCYGMAYNLDRDEVGIILLDDSENLKAGCEVLRTGRVLDAPVGEELLGRVIDATGRPLDNKGTVSTTKRLPVEREAPGIMQRAPVTVPLQTGIKVIDALIPIGRGILPAVDVGRSVSRVGGKTQLPAYRAVAGDLRLSYSQFEELEAFSRFGSRLDDATQKSIDRGQRVREVLKQRQYRPIPVAEQIVVLLAVIRGVFDDVALDKIGGVEKSVRQAVREQLPELYQRIEAGQKLSEGDRCTIVNTAQKMRVNIN